MKLKAIQSDSEHELVLDLKEARVDVRIDGERLYQLEVRHSGENSYLLVAGSRVYECRVDARPGMHETFDVALRSKTYSITVVDPRRLRTDQDSDRHHHGTIEITAPMPGKVVRLVVEAGQEIASGAGIVVVEAMKMQNEMKSPRAGVVVSLNVKSGDTVEAGQLLAVIE